MARKTIHVIPGKSGWELKRSSAVRASGTYATKRAATTAARQLASEQNLDVIIYERGRRFTEIRTSDPELVGDAGKFNSQNKFPVSAKSGSAKSSPRNGKTLPQAKSKLWREWANNHKKGASALSDEAISRESIYGERG
jgi:hypothetical protein